MVVQLQKVGNEFVVPPQVAQQLNLVDGSTVDIHLVEEPAPAFHYATVEEALKAFEETLPQHEAAYRALAK